MKKLLLILAGLGVFGLLSAIGLFAWASKDLPSPDKLIERQVNQSTKIYDRTGTHLLYEVFGEKRRTLVELKDIPDYAKWATVVLEDKNFYSHSGVAWLSIIRAGIANALHLSTGRGGASTLTQQFVKNAILTDERSIARKIKEAILALEIERKYSKDEILKMYLNEIPYGSTNYGIEASSQSYFGVAAKDLSLAQAATLAAMIQAPSKYMNNLDQLKVRRDYTLDLLVENKHVTKELADAAKKEEIKLSKNNGLTVAPHFVLYVKELLSEKYGEKMVDAGGLNVITTLDYDMQKIAEEEVKNGAEKNEKKYNANNAALVAMDPKTGQILAMVGSRDFNNDKIDGQVNVALSKRQPGSSFKPIVYVTGFSKGLTPDTKLYDTTTVFKTDLKDFTPHDYDMKERGLVTLRQALAGSLNIPAVKVLYLTGIDTVLDTAQKLGYTTLNDRSRFGLALVLGGAEVKLIEHVHTFTVFANEGQTVPYTSILEIKDAQGKTLEKFSDPEKTQVLDQQPVRQLVDIMTDNNARTYIFGANSPLTLPDRPVAAKTGTTNDWHDGWTMGFTPSLVAGVWAGNNNNKAMTKGADGVLVAAPIWHNFMARALKDKPVETFTAPDPYPTDIKPILVGQGMGEVTVNINRLNGKLATTQTPAELIETRTYKQPHDILYYLNINDIKGPPPQDPTTDPQFTGWEAGALAWAQKQNITSDTMPTEYDDGSAAVPNLPKVTITAPTANQVINTRDLEVKIDITNTDTVNMVNLYIDNDLIQSNPGAPFSPLSLQTHLYELPRGYHNVKIRVFTNSGAYSEASTDFNLTAADDPATAIWSFPIEGTTLNKTQFPVSLKLQVYQLAKIKKLSVAIYKDGDSANKKILSTINNPTDRTVIIPYSKPPAAGNYFLETQIETMDGQSYTGQAILITVQ